MFKCLTFDQCLKANKDAEIRAQFLTRPVNLQKVAEEYNRIENLRHDIQTIDNRENFQTHATRKETNKKGERNFNKTKPCRRSDKTFVKLLVGVVLSLSACMLKSPYWNVANENF